jgi:hypothetical protein
MQKSLAFCHTAKNDEKMIAASVCAPTRPRNAPSVQPEPPSSKNSRMIRLSPSKFRSATWWADVPIARHVSVAPAAFASISSFPCSAAFFSVLPKTTSPSGPHYLCDAGRCPTMAQYTFSSQIASRSPLSVERASHTGPVARAPGGNQNPRTLRWTGARAFSHFGQVAIVKTPRSKTSGTCRTCLRRPYTAPTADSLATSCYNPFRRTVRHRTIPARLDQSATTSDGNLFAGALITLVLSHYW